MKERKDDFNSRREHLAAIELAGITKIVIVQNKIDIVDEKRALKS